MDCLSLRGMQAVAQEARFACVRRLLEVEGQRRYAFLESTEQTLAAHLRNAHRSWEVSMLRPGCACTAVCCCCGHYLPAG